MNSADTMPEPPPFADSPNDGCDDSKSTRAAASQILPARRIAAGVAAGARVWARGRSWRVHAVTPFPSCVGVSLAPLSAGRTPCTLLLPFDRVVALRAVSRFRPCGLRNAAAHLSATALEADASGVGILLGPDLALLPWQWAAATALCDGHASIVLVADAVGLGKTIQAALAIVALRARGHGERVLILTPAALRDQWHAEIERLFRLKAAVIDAVSLRRARRTMPAHANPWTACRTAIASLDFVKQPEILAAAAGAFWDVVVVDEAHTLGPRTDRRAAAGALATRARHVLLLTATPHSGDDDDFEALCAIGQLADDTKPTLVIRRMPADVGLQTTRRVRIALVHLGEAERRVHAELRAYARAVWEERNARPGARLAMTVLLKRAASGMWALHRSVAHRLQLLRRDSREAPAQPLLPFDDSGETDSTDAELPAALGEPGLDERSRELQWLARIDEAALVAAVHDSKLAWLVRFIRRVRERVVVFTEYRDTLRACFLALQNTSADPARDGTAMAVLHGGLTRAERVEALHAFTAGGARVLVATDVASEGLNLHRRCRLVVNLELPWNPLRLEQRIGRIDRIGQPRRVHAVHIVGRAGAERFVLDRLALRVRAARSALVDAYGAVGLSAERVVAEALGVDPPEILERATSPFTPWQPDPHLPRHTCALLDGLRRLSRIEQHPANVTRRPRERLPLVMLGPRVRARLGLAPGAVLIFRVDVMTQAGRSAADALIAVHVALAPAGLRFRPASRLVSGVLPIARAAARAHAASLLASGIETHRAYTERALAREEAMHDAYAKPGGHPAALLQAGLFDRRALVKEARRRADRDGWTALHAVRRAQLALDARLEPEWRIEPLAALVMR
jgi:superfamily II DNA or RNA helicase